MSQARPQKENGDSNRQHATIAALFLFLIVLLAASAVSYWFYILEPQLELNAQSSANALGQVHVHNLSQVVTRVRHGERHELVDEYIGESVVLHNDTTDAAFITGIRLRFDRDILDLPDHSHWAPGSGERCDDCLVSSLPVYDSRSSELIAVADYHFSNRFSLQMKNKVRANLFIGTALLAAILLFAGLFIGRLLNNAERNLENFRKLFDATPFPMALASADTGEALKVNRAATEFFQLDPTRRGGLFTRDFYKQPQQREGLLRRLNEKGSINNQELEVVTSGGESHWVLLSAYPITYMDTAVNLIGMADITPIKRIQSELEVARKRAESATIAKSRFLANMSHELRTPISGAIGLSELLEKTPLDSEQRSYNASIHNSLKTLLGIINDILDLSRIEAGKMPINPSPVDIHALAADVLRIITPSAERKGLELVSNVATSPPYWVMADDLRLRQLLLNLLGNAVKFTERGEIKLWFTPVSDGGEGIRFDVSDTGCGIPPEFLEHIFEPFTQADDSCGRSHGGTGLGLSICHRLSLLMDGTISVESRQGEGSTFSVSLPLPAASAPCAAQAVLKVEGARRFNARVLLAEDDPINRLVAERFLGELGCRVESVGDGREAIERFQGGGYDLIIMDRNMPHTDGLQAARAIRELEGDGPRTPIIALTANAMHGDHEISIAAGMDEHMEKPLDIGKLGGLLYRYCAHTLLEESDA